MQALDWFAKQDSNAAVIVVCSSVTSKSLATYLDPATLSKLSPTQIIHFLPLSTLMQRDFYDVARVIYDRFPRQPHRTHHVTEGEAPWYQYPSFTLSPEDPPKPKLTLQWPIKSFDVFGSWRWVHAAYAYSPDSQSIIVIVSDAEGENWQVKVIPTKPDATRSAKIGLVWEFASAFASSAAVEWRLSVCHLGLMRTDELEGEAHFIAPSQYND